ncbi:MAG: response regulator [Sphingomonas sp.]
MSRRILVVDDDPHIRDLLAFALGKAGMTAEQAADGEEALAAIAVNPPDLMVLDINMPRLDGLELCRRCGAAAAPRRTCRSCSSPRATTRSTGSSGSRSAPTIMSPSPSPRARWSRASARSSSAGRASLPGPPPVPR